MFEFDKYEKALHRDSPATPVTPFMPASDIAAMSLLVWGEHCVECAAPSCFVSCDLYQPRPDQRCRRFAFGAYKNTAFPSSRGYGVEVVFKKWAKLEARGNTSMRRLDSVLRHERWIGAGARIANGVGRLANKLTGDIRWSYLTHALLERLIRRLHRSSKDDLSAKPDVFLLEVYNPTAETARMQLSSRSLTVPQG